MNIRKAAGYALFAPVLLVIIAGLLVRWVFETAAGVRGRP